MPTGEDSAAVASGPNPRKLRIGLERHREGRLLARLREPRLHPELHGSMARIAPLLDLELIALDRACCTGAGVIAEHNQELADTLNARTFALAQQTDERDDDEHLLHLPGRDERVPGAARREHAVPRAHQRQPHRRALSYEKGIVNKNLLWVLVEDLGLDELRSRVRRPLPG